MKRSDKPFPLPTAVIARDNACSILRLYVIGTSPSFARAVMNIRKICEDLEGRYELQIVDIAQNPTLAEGERIIAAPALIKQLPLPLRRCIGDLSQTERILVGLDLRAAGNGEAIQVESSVNRLQGADGRPPSGQLAVIRKAEAELRESEQRYRSLFQNMREGVAYCRVVFEGDQARDVTYLSVNPAFERLTGLTNVVGKNLTEIVPGIRESHPELLEIYGRASRTGQREQFESYIESLGAWFAVSVYGQEKGCIVAVFDNVTEHRRLEKEILQVSENGQKRLGQEFHEDLGQQLAALSLLTSLHASILRTEGHSQAADAEEVVQMFKQTILTARSLAKGFYPIELDRGGLVIALSDLTQQITSQTGINLQFRHNDSFQPVKEQEIHLYRMVQEGINDSIQRGNARNILVECTSFEGNPILRITDDGGGFPPPEADKAGIDLRLFHYRARLVGAKIHVAKGQAGGCQVTCSLAQASEIRPGKS